MKTFEKFEDYTEAEFLEFVTKICMADVKSEREHIQLVKHFEKITEHPQGNGVIFYPDPEIEDSPQGITDFIKRWREANGKPGFKRSH
ncbi:colicin E9 immunity protein [Pseudomonas sp. StFLB209]|uniref:bacteriocin immunity protein n=1 Tax=Pseudomonas sp. StFLB209 TaxID=1028989 RepID=UPI0004F79CD9|nr:bacteriocin immunity protein [Pseudomonas sp. StFLB209]BAP42000.1 colicin E9 immunity protein [Pseudomonas sp. StFLB209]